MKRSTSWFATALLLVAVPVWAQSDSGSKAGKYGHGPQAKIGEPVPNFTLQGVNGKDFKLAEFKGKIVVLEWINYECPEVNHCYASQIMTNTWKKFKDKSVVWVAIDSNHFCKDKVENIRTWIKRQKLEYPYLLDADGKVGHMFGAKKTPQMFVIGQNGVLAYSGAIDNDPQGKEQNKRNYVEEAITSLIDGSTVAMPKTKPYGCKVNFKK